MNMFYLIRFLLPFLYLFILSYTYFSFFQTKNHYKLTFSANSLDETIPSVRYMYVDNPNIAKT